MAAKLWRWIPRGNVYITDPHNNQVVKLPPR